MAVALQQRLRVFHVEIFELQHRVWPASHHRVHELQPPHAASELPGLRFPRGFGMLTASVPTLRL